MDNKAAIIAMEGMVGVASVLIKRKIGIPAFPCQWQAVTTMQQL
jgi:hypothetical protein